MAFETNKPVKHLIVDAMGFFKATPLERIGEKVYTVPEVIAEIRDAATRQRLQILPYELHFIEPTAEELHHVTEFSKKTGDYSTLSATDLKLIAAVYQLEKKHGDVDKLRKEPVAVVSYTPVSKRSDYGKDVVGFYTGKLSSTNKNAASSTLHESELERLTLGEQNNKDPDAATCATGSREPEKLSSDKVNHEDSEHSVVDDKSDDEQCEDEITSDDYDEDVNEDEDEEQENEDDFEDGWITPGNLTAAINKSQQGHGVKEEMNVACLTSDFAVQNVLLHMGLQLTSHDGLHIKKLRSSLLRCYGCFKTTSDMTKMFCPNCGNNTLKRVGVSVDPETGEMKIHLSARKLISVRGTRVKPPRFQGGKHQRNPILYADQPLSKDRLSNKALQQQNVMDPDYVARDSPFLMKDITSRSAMLRVRPTVRPWRPSTVARHGKKRGGKRH